MILSLLLIWFGIHQRRTNLFSRIEDFEAGMDLRENPMVEASNSHCDRAAAVSGALMIGPAGEEPTDGFAITDGAPRSFNVEQPLLRHAGAARSCCST